MKSLNKIKKTKEKNKSVSWVLMVFIVSLLLFSSIFTLIKINRQKIEETFGAIQGSLQWELTPSATDLFNCGGRDDCADDIDLTLHEPQHKYIAQAYDLFGFPLAGVKYKWTQDDSADLIKFRELNPASAPVDASTIAVAETDQEIYVQTNEENLQNGEAAVNVLGYIDDESKGKSQAVDVTLFFCLNTWPSTVTFPFSDSASPQSNPYSNFETYYCKDRGDITNTDDDYTALKVVERAKKPSDDYSFLCSGGGGNGLKCDRDYYIVYNTITGWGKGTLDNYLGNVPANISSADAVGLVDNKILVNDGNEWAYYNGAGWTSGNLSFSTPVIINPWPTGLSGDPLKPTAMALNDVAIGWILIEDNFYVKNGPVNQLPEYSASPDRATLAEAGWPTDVQFPDEVSWWSNVGNNYLLALKNNYYRIYSKNNSCNADNKCETPDGRTWGDCATNNECYWGERFNLFDVKDWPTSISGWQSNIRFPIKTIGIDANNIVATSSCEQSGGVCLLKEFLLVANPACSDNIDNDDDGFCDWQDNICGAGILKDPDCVDPDDNSESGDCDDGIDNDNDGAIDYPNDFSCSSYSDIEEEGCVTACCDNIDNDADGLIDQADHGCTDNADLNEVNACADGVDNDSDGLFDLADPGCADAIDDSEKGSTQCDDGIDNDGDGFIDMFDAECSESGDDNESN